LDLETSLDETEGGLFYYTVNGVVAESTVGSETGQVFVPEFGVVAAGAALVGAGYYVARKRKQ
jgi:LPXTG-motif cell wall-anchored protein